MSFKVCLRGLLLSLSLLLSVGAYAAPVNLNTADAAEMADTLKGVGLKKAEAIVAYREQHGPFKSVQDLANVKGIGEKTLADNLDLITVADAPATDKKAAKETIKQ